MAGVGVVIVAWRAGDRANGRMVLRTTAANGCRRARKVSAETTRLNDRDFNAKGADLFREYFRKPFDAPLGGGIRRAAQRSDSPADGAELDDMPLSLLTHDRVGALAHYDYPASIPPTPPPN